MRLRRAALFFRRIIFQRVHRMLVAWRLYAEHAKVLRAHAIRRIHGVRLKILKAWHSWVRTFVDRRRALTLKVKLRCVGPTFRALYAHMHKQRRVKNFIVRVLASKKKRAFENLQLWRMISTGAKCIQRGVRCYFAREALRKLRVEAFVSALCMSIVDASFYFF